MKRRKKTRTHMHTGEEEEEGRDKDNNRNMIKGWTGGFESAAERRMRCDESDRNRLMDDLLELLMQHKLICVGYYSSLTRPDLPFHTRKYLELGKI